jgi:hypothetical protein
VPSFLCPVLVDFTPPSDASRTIFMLVIGFESGGLDLDLATLRFQVPSELSAPNMPMAVIAVPITHLARILRIYLLLLTFSKLVGGSCLEVSGALPRTFPYRSADRTLNWLIAPDSFPGNQSRRRSYHD